MFLRIRLVVFALLVDFVVQRMPAIDPPAIGAHLEDLEPKPLVSIADSAVEIERAPTTPAPVVFSPTVFQCFDWDKPQDIPHMPPGAYNPGEQCPVSSLLVHKGYATMCFGPPPPPPSQPQPPVSVFDPATQCAVSSLLVPSGYASMSFGPPPPDAVFDPATQCAAPVVFSPTLFQSFEEPVTPAPALDACLPDEWRTNSSFECPAYLDATQIFQLEEQEERAPVMPLEQNCLGVRRIMLPPLALDKHWSFAQTAAGIVLIVWSLVKLRRLLPPWRKLFFFAVQISEPILEAVGEEVSFLLHVLACTLVLARSAPGILAAIRHRLSKPKLATAWAFFNPWRVWRTISSFLPHLTMSVRVRIYKTRNTVFTRAIRPFLVALVAYVDECLASGAADTAFPVSSSTQSPAQSDLDPDTSYSEQASSSSLPSTPPSPRASQNELVHKASRRRKKKKKKPPVQDAGSIAPSPPVSPASSSQSPGSTTNEPDSGSDPCSAAAGSSTNSGALARSIPATPSNDDPSTPSSSSAPTSMPADNSALASDTFNSETSDDDDDEEFTLVVAKRKGGWKGKQAVVADPTRHKSARASSESAVEANPPARVGCSVLCSNVARRTASSSSSSRRPASAESNTSAQYAASSESPTYAAAKIAGPATGVVSVPQYNNRYTFLDPDFSVD